MTKKNYIVFAQMIKEFYQEAKGKPEQEAIIEKLCDKISDIFWQDNDRFDYKRFREACGIEL